MTIHKEGRALLFGLLIALFAINALLAYLFPNNTLLQQIAIGISIVLYIAVLQFFRNPKVVVQTNDKHILAPADGRVVRSEEHTSELQSRENLVCRLLLENKKES